MEAEYIGRARRCPDGAIVGLLKIHRHGHRPLAEDIQARAASRPFVAALHHDIGGREPHQSVAIAEDMGDSVPFLIGRQSFNHNLLSLFGGCVIHEEAFCHRRYPEVLLLIGRHCDHRRVLDDAVQIAVAAAELLLIVIVGKEAFVVGAQPNVLP